jgi:thiamine pyrophosphate-dependent acetolactate synthase large subunit-like protein
MGFGRFRPARPIPTALPQRGTYGTMGVGLGQAIAACVVHPDRPVIHLSGDSAIGFSGWKWRRWSATTSRARSSS